MIMTEKRRNTEDKSIKSLKSFSIIFGVSVFVLFIMTTNAIINVDAALDDGLLKKYTPNGEYKVEMSWSPLGEIEPGKEYTFDFTISDSVTERTRQNISFNLDTVQNGRLIDTTSESSQSGIISKTLSFDESGITHIILSDINGSEQSVDFTFNLDGNENPHNYGKRLKGVSEPQMYFCGYEKNVRTLAECFKTETYEDYGWWGKANVLIYAPGWNEDENKIDWIGNTSDSPIGGYARGDGNTAYLNGPCGFAETGINTGLFVGRVKLTGFDHDVDGSGEKNTSFGGTSCKNSKPWYEAMKLESGREGAFTVYWEYQNDPVKVVSKTATYSWMVGELDFLKDEYFIGETVEIKMWDRDMRKVEGKDSYADLKIEVWSDTDKAGITVQPEDIKMKKPFIVELSETKESGGYRLQASPGDTIYAKYVDYTLPIDEEGAYGGPFDKNDHLDIMAYATVGK